MLSDVALVRRVFWRTWRQRRITSVMSRRRGWGAEGVPGALALHVNLTVFFHEDDVVADLVGTFLEGFW